jgi:hypothetical protein
LTIKEGCAPFKKLPTIKCECGAEILLIPQVDLMSKAIDNHVEGHKAKISNHIKADTLAKRIEDHLIRQVFEKIQYSHEIL